MITMTRRRLLGYGVGAGAALAVPWGAGTARGAAGGKLFKYLEPLPVPGNGIVVATPTGSRMGATQYAFTQRELTRQLHPQLPETTFWAYDDGSGLAGQAGSFGMALVAQRQRRVEVAFANALPPTYPAWVPVDTRLTPLGNQVRVMTHLHGGFVAAADDGNPSITPNGFGYGQTQSVVYPNEQPSALLWFHDHGLGSTRLNVFAGLAAAYLLRDGYDTGTADNANGLPSGPYEVPLVIQDRQFDFRSGDFLYPTSDIPGVTWIGEYFGDVMLVNGKVWPYFNVEPRLYRFRVLNGSNARILNLGIGGTRMWQIGADGGLFDAPVPVSNVVLAPAERADLLVDFSALAGLSVQLKNSSPPPGVVTPAPALSQVMQFNVASGTPVAPTIPTAFVGGTAASLPDPGPAKRRFFTLNEFGVDTPGWRLTINGVGFDAPDVDAPARGDVEEWYYVNLTGDTHPMHTHLFMFQVVGRVPFDAEAYEEAAPETSLGSSGIDPTPYFTGPMAGPGPTERGFKDTVKANPGQVTIVRGKFDLPSTAHRVKPQTYVHHCHIVEHEDNDMMRPYTVR